MCHRLLRLFPFLLYLRYPKMKSGYMYYNKKYSFSNDALVKKDYNFLKNYTQNGVQSGDNHVLKGFFSPLGLRLNQSVCEVLNKMGSPGYITKNSDLMKKYYTMYYKKKIGKFKCMFELHFHRHKLFLCQISVHDKSQTNSEGASSIVQSFLGDYINTGIAIDFNKKPSYHFIDKQGDSVSILGNFFKTHFIFADPHNDSIDLLLSSKYNTKEHRREEYPEYQNVFVHG